MDLVDLEDDVDDDKNLFTLLNKTSFKFFHAFDLIHDIVRFSPLQKCFGYF